MPGDCRFISLKKLSHLILAKPNGFVFERYFNFSQTVFGLVHYDLTITLQRCASHLASRTDVNEAYAVGGAAAAAAFAGETGRMIALKRISAYPYQCITESVDVQQVANLEKKVPLDWIAPDGMQVTAAFEEYARPLILDEVTPVYVNGTPRHIRL